jgi:heme exporter protein D
MHGAELLQIGPMAFLIGGALAAVIVVLALQWVKHMARRRRVLRAARASHAERAAAQVLVDAGYAILGRQVRRTWSVLAEEQELRFDLIADYLVEGAGVRWVAEVKTGERALSLRHGPTRRQLLEYRQAFGVAGVLLVDAEARHVTRVRFREPVARRGSVGRALFWWGAGLLVGLALARYWPGGASLGR